MGQPRNIVAAGPSGRVRLEYIEGRLVSLQGGGRRTVEAWSGRARQDDAGRRQQRLRLVAENGNHPSARASRGHLRAVRY